MKRLLIIALCAALAACCPCRHLTFTTRDSVRVETIVHTERVQDTVLVEVPVEAIRQTVRDTTSHLETSFAVSDARINPDGSLFHSLENIPQKRPIPIEKDIVYTDTHEYHGHEEAEIVEVARQLTRWQQTQMRGFWVLLAVVVLIAGKKFVSLTRRII